MNKSILFIAHHFPPMAGPGVHRTIRFVKELTRRGHNVTVLTIREEDLRSALKDPLKDYSLLNQIPDSIHIIRTPTYEPIEFKRLMMRLRIYRLFWFLAYPLLWESCALWPLSALPAALDWVKEHPDGIVYSSSGPFTAILIGVIIKMRTGRPYVADLRDPFTDGYMWKWPSKTHWRVSRAVEHYLLNKANAVIVNTPAVKRLYGKREVRTKGVYVIPNGFDEIQFSQVYGSDHEELKLGKQPLRIAYAGTLAGYSKQQLEKEWTKDSFWKRLRYDLLAYQVESIDKTTRSGIYLLYGVMKCCKRYGYVPQDFYLDFFGSIDKQHSQLALELGIGKALHIGGYVPKAKAIRKMQSADLLFLPLESSRNGQEPYFIPGKIYEYMALAKPILLLAEPSDARTIAERSGLAIACDPRDPDKIAETLHRLQQMKRQNKLVCQPNWSFIEKFSSASLTNRLEQVFESVVNPQCHVSDWDDFMADDHITRIT